MKKIRETKARWILYILPFLVIAVLLGLLLRPAGRNEEEGVSAGGRMAYEANIVTDDADSLQDAVDRLVEKAKEGQMALEMQTEASSADGKNFKCYLANSVKNKYDMFMVFYLDETEEEIYRTGLIPIGARIESFVLDGKLDAGSHEVTVVFNQVEEDGETIHAQVNVGLLLSVSGD